MACALYRRSTAYVRLPTTLIGMIDAAIAIKVGGNLAEKHKNRIGAFHPHSGVIIDFSLLATLSEAHVRNGVAELIKISTVEHLEAFELLEKHTEDLIKYKFGFVEGSPAGLREVGQKIAKMCVQKMLELQHLLHAHLRNLLPDLAQARRRALHKAELVLDEVLGVLLEKLESLEVLHRRDLDELRNPVPHVRL